jgi:peptidoglycan/xylan/chitin deacetylase (PgdA/CDA1 family)
MVIRNFLFHRVSDEVDTMWPPIKPSLFSKIISYLTRNYRVVPLENYLDNPAAFQSKQKIATVLFDDGYKDNIECAVPILDKFKCPASFYVVSDCIDKNIPTWTFILDNAVLKTKKQHIELNYDFVPGRFNLIQVKDKSQLNTEIRKEVKPWLKKLSNQQRLLIVQSILSQCDDVPAPEKTMMNWNELRQMQAAGYMIGSHSVSHPLLASVEDEKELFFELKGSGERIRSELGKFPAGISSPIGRFDQRVIACSKTAGYHFGLAVQQRFYDTSNDDLFAIPRTELSNEPAWKCKLRINGIYSWIKDKVK